MSTKKTFKEVVKYYFTDEEKHQIVQDYLSSGLTKEEIWEKYTGKKKEHGQILSWIRKFNYDNDSGKPTLAPKFNEMKKEQNQEDESFENLQLKKRIAELEKQLKDAEMKAIAYSTMIDIAEKELKIKIRKKSNTKP